MLLSEIVDTAIAKAVGPSRPETLIDVNRKFVEAMVNEAQRKVEQAEMWRFSEAIHETTATVGDRTVALPEDLQLILGVYNASMRLDLPYLDERQGTPDHGDSTGRPEAYSFWAGVLKLWPTPSRADELQIRYYKVWPELANDNDEPVLPETWQHLLVDYATGQLILRIPPTGDRFLPASAAEPYMQAFWSGLESMRNSPLSMTVGDEVRSHPFEEMIAEGEW